MQRALRITLRVCLLVCVGLAPAVGTGAGALTSTTVAGSADLPAAGGVYQVGTTPDSGRSTQASTPEGTPGVSVTVSRPSSGILSITATYEVPASLSGLRVGLGRLDPVSSRGFEQCGSGQMCWDGATDNPSVTVRYDLDRYADSYMTVINDSAVFTPTPDIYTTWRPAGTEGESKSASLFASGAYASYETGREVVIGNATLFYGSHTEYDRRANGTTFRLVVPDGVTLGPAREDLLAALAGAGRTLTIGGRNDEVIVVAMENTPQLAATGLAGATIGNAYWARADGSLASTHNVWLHEYVHTRQRFADRSQEMEWFVEASAEYYAARLSHDLGSVDDLQYEWELKSRRASASDSVLADPMSWEQPNVPYRKGALVLAALDARIRERTDGQHTLEDVFRRLNGDGERLTYPRFVEAVVTVSDDPALADWLDRYVRTGAVPTYHPQEPTERLPNPPRIEQLGALAPTSPVGFGVATVGLVVASMLTLSVLSAIGHGVRGLIRVVIDVVGWLADWLAGSRP
jgi:hypothetical protein